MTKTPYEIRLDLLAMAQSIISENNFLERNRLEQNWQHNRELDIIAAQKGAGSATPLASFPEFKKTSETEIIAMAQKLNEFISNS